MAKDNESNKIQIPIDEILKPPPQDEVANAFLLQYPEYIWPLVGDPAISNWHEISDNYTWSLLPDPDKLLSDYRIKGIGGNIRSYILTPTDENRVVSDEFMEKAVAKVHAVIAQKAQKMRQSILEVVRPKFDENPGWYRLEKYGEISHENQDKFKDFVNEAARSLGYGDLRACRLDLTKLYENFFNTLHAEKTEEYRLTRQLRNSQDKVKTLTQQLENSRGAVETLTQQLENSQDEAQRQAEAQKDANAKTIRNHNICAAISALAAVGIGALHSYGNLPELPPMFNIATPSCGAEANYFIKTAIKVLSFYTDPSIQTATIAMTILGTFAMLSLATKPAELSPSA
jgi:hypothetical protein